MNIIIFVFKMKEFLIYNDFSSIGRVFIFSIKLSRITDFSSPLCDETPIIVLVSTLIFTIVQANGCCPPPSLKNSITSKSRATQD